ncbi:hypothetical protein [Streptomyces litchfieldiae]|uniref:Uncharacterized protein n=1 Tax=Streptomyces litchfieldiae TaxID=3075543 RepID=A0ABU2MKI1_9ACTN|nr:hypothetical protein [Streptomyces sp. DSM 44938]MDT0341986.1 hypothetical protein [Streptomyces sp. DSM 44938]
MTMPPPLQPPAQPPPLPPPVARTFRNRFTATGRMRNRWADALARPDPREGLAALREIRDRLAGRPGLAAPLWVPFIASMTGPPFRPLLAEGDFTALAEAGRELAGGGGFTLEEAWRPLIRAREARGEDLAAAELLTALYWAPQAADERTRAVFADELARTGRRDEERLRVYGDLLRRPGPHPPSVVALATGALATGFATEPEQLRLAAALAEAAEALRLPGGDRTRGLHHLLVLRDPVRAREHFTAACAADLQDDTALQGLLAAHVQAGDAAGTPGWALARGRVAPAAGPLAQLAQLADTLIWFDADTDSGPPLTATALAALAVRPQAGDWLDYARGRLHLIEGDADAARATLVPAAHHHPERGVWAYHAAWAELLTGHHDGLRRRAAEAPPGAAGWALRCLLQDADPRHAATAPPDTPPAGYERLAAVRRELAAGTRSAVDPGALPPGGGVPDRLEALRTALGDAFGRSGATGMAPLLRHALYRRLPRAERLLWSGVRALTAEPEEGIRLLDEARRLGHTRRAALVLAAHHLGTGRPRPARALLEPHTDAKARLLAAWAEVAASPEESVTDATDAAVARLEALGPGVPPQVHYALGVLRLRRSLGTPGARAAVARAAKDFDAALAVGSGSSVPRDALVLSLATAAVAADGAADPLPAELWPAVARHPWAEWVLGLTALAGDPDGTWLGLAERLRELAEQGERPPEAAVTGLAAALTRAALLSTDAPRRHAFTAMTGRLARRHPHAEVRRLADLAAVAALALPAADGGDAAPGVPLTTLVDRPLLALATAGRALATGQRAAAVERLRVPVGDTPEGRACALLADVLQGRAPATAPEGGGETAALLRVAWAAGRADDDPEAALDALATTVAECDLAAVVDLSRLLPALCARLATGGPRRPGRAHPLAAPVRRLGERDTPALPAAVHARCAAVVGEYALAGRLWPRAVAEEDRALGGGELSAARTEFIRLLGHRAVAARADGDPLRAARLLRHAARVGSGGPAEAAPGEEGDLR